MGTTSTNNNNNNNNYHHNHNNKDDKLNKSDRGVCTTDSMGDDDHDINTNYHHERNKVHDSRALIYPLSIESSQAAVNITHNNSSHISSSPHRHHHHHQSHIRQQSLRRFCCKRIKQQVLIGISVITFFASCCVYFYMNHPSIEKNTETILVHVPKMIKTTTTTTTTTKDNSNINNNNNKMHNNKNLDPVSLFFPNPTIDSSPSLQQDEGLDGRKDEEDVNDDGESNENNDDDDDRSSDTTTTTTFGSYLLSSLGLETTEVVGGSSGGDTILLPMQRNTRIENNNNNNNVLKKKKKKKRKKRSQTYQRRDKASILPPDNEHRNSASLYPDENNNKDKDTLLVSSSSSSTGSRSTNSGNNGGSRYTDMIFPFQVSLHAAEALQCRESVKNFVVNATDGKDECDGLIKAYEKTCSINIQQQQVSHDENDRNNNNNNNNQQQQQQQRIDVVHNNGDETSNHNRLLNENNYFHSNVSLGHESKKNRRRLWQKLNTPIILRWRAHLFQTKFIIRRFYRNIRQYFGYVDDISSIFFFAEDEVYKAYDDAQYLVSNNIQIIVQSDARRSMDEGQCLSNIAEAERRQRHRILESTKDERSGTSDNDNRIDSGGTTTTTTITNLQLPVKSDEHLSEKFTSDALLFQEKEIIDLALNESYAAQEDAAKSKKSIADTVGAVSAVLSDPSSKEAMTCCSSILNVFHELCSTDVEEQVSDTRLFFFVFVLACCGMVKSLIRHFKILWLPEAAGCILVGVISGYVLDMFPHHDVSFDGNWFLRILVPPIIFQAALSIDKRSFNRHLIPIIIYAVAGTLMATFLTAVIVHYGTNALAGWCEPIPYVEALTFGALISSIDPIAVLSVLHNMGMNDTDTIYVLIFGESLLNDGVAIVLFHTLVHFLDEELIIDQEAIVAAIVHFFVVAFGSLIVGVASGMISTVYFWSFYGCQTPLVEVLMFICWALLPYYVCDGIGWSGIVAAVAVGFVMDLHIIGLGRAPLEDEGLIFDASDRTASSFDSDGNRPKSLERSRRPIFNKYGHLSSEARAHVGFVTEIMATGMETAIFAYLGFFLISHRYHWNLIHVVIAIIACCGSRAIMIPFLSLIANGITRIQQRRGICKWKSNAAPNWKGNSPGVIVDKKMQFALWFSGLRGAMSFALVESIPLYDSFSGEGTRLKPELKAMTSASIMFTVFVLGGYTYYILERLGISPANRRSTPTNAYEVTALINNNHKSHMMDIDEDNSTTDHIDVDKVETPKQHAVPGSAFRRARHTQIEPMIMI